MVSILNSWHSFDHRAGDAYSPCSPRHFQNDVRQPVAQIADHPLDPFINVLIGSSKTATTCLRIEPSSEGDMWSIMTRLRELLRVQARILAENAHSHEYLIISQPSYLPLAFHKSTPVCTSTSCATPRQSSPANVATTKASVVIMRRALQEEAALAIQKVIRGRLGRRLAAIFKSQRAVEEANTPVAVRLQRAWKGFVTRRRREFEQLVKQIMEIRYYAATVMQKYIRNFLARRQCEFEDLVCSIMNQRATAAITLQRVFRGMLARRVAKQEASGFVISWRPFANEVHVAGSFTSPAWGVLHPLRFCTVRDRFVLDLSTMQPHPGTHYVKFCVDGSWLCDDRLEMQTDEKGNVNNVIYFGPRQSDVPTVVVKSPTNESPFVLSPPVSHLSYGQPYSPHSPSICTAVNYSPARHPSLHVDTRRPSPSSSSSSPAAAAVPAPYVRTRTKLSRSHTETADISPRSLSNRRTLSISSCSPNNVAHSVLAFEPVTSPVPADLTTKSAAFMIPHPEKAARGGADAFVIEDSTGIIGVADGVGEWESYGVDPQIFARELMDNCRLMSGTCAQYEAHASSNFILTKQATAGRSSQALQVPVINTRAASNARSRSPSPVRKSAAEIQEWEKDPLRLLERSAMRVKGFGSSTALLCSVTGNKLKFANVGDSAFLVVRRIGRHYGVVYRSVEQQHGFNCPYQLSHLPPPESFPTLLAAGFDTLVKVLEKTKYLPRDQVHDAMTGSVLLREGDLVIAGTDGVFDNLFDHEILSLIAGAVSPREAKMNHSVATCPHQLARAIASAASEKASDTHSRSPFAQSAVRQGYNYWGGKLDDITVVVSWIVSRPDA
eukprot:GILJ01004969.1.p1 GENE.GILJ01004969.1~~GILJ01004969.1.p1  ORF type:complete len:838 (+),score=85.19 GILJ01004969.1:165-2678(+)